MHSSSLCPVIAISTLDFPTRGPYLRHHIVHLMLEDIPSNQTCLEPVLPRTVGPGNLP